MYTDVINTLPNGERVTSTYADIYLDDDYCAYTKPVAKSLQCKKLEKDIHKERGEWTSPSDLLIGIIDLQPPFTSKITRGITHEGILAIGEGVLEKEREKFLKHLNGLLEDNDAVWTRILNHKKNMVEAKAKQVYLDIFLQKSKTMQEEISTFYESSLQELEDFLRSEIQQVLMNAYAQIVSDLNTEIKTKLEKQKLILENILKNKYECEVYKIKCYYKLLLGNELNRINTYIKYAVFERNDALKAFYKQYESENITSTMYIMCTERKKCRIKQFILDNYQTIEIDEKLQKIKERQDLINVFREKDEKILNINTRWQEKIQKVLQLFLKFIAFSLKLLPEQTTFLLNFEKMFVLQLNEMQKMPKKVSSILIDEEKFKNVFKFEEPKQPEVVCEKKPFVLVGDLSDTPPRQFRSTETLPSDVELPYFTVQKEFVYAKCHKFEQIKALLDSEVCKCLNISLLESSSSTSSSSSKESIEAESVQKIEVITDKTESSMESLLVDDIKRLRECPARYCQEWVKGETFPNLNFYLNYTKENFATAKAILDGSRKKTIMPQLIDPKAVSRAELQFSATKEPYHNAETQYSSQEDLFKANVTCTCVDNIMVKRESLNILERSHSTTLNEIMTKRKHSLNRLLQQNPKLLQFFTDESFDFQM